MQKRFFTKSIIFQGVMGGIIGVCVLIPSFKLYDTHRWAGLAGGFLFALLVSTLGMIIDAKFKDQPNSQVVNEDNLSK